MAACALLAHLHVSLAFITPTSYRGYFVDLFVRKSNRIATQLYEKLGYIVYRTVLNYYSGEHEEDAYGKSNQAVHVAPIPRVSPCVSPRVSPSIAQT